MKIRTGKNRILNRQIAPADEKKSYPCPLTPLLQSIVWPVLPTEFEDYLFKKSQTCPAELKSKPKREKPVSNFKWIREGFFN